MSFIKKGRLFYSTKNLNKKRKKRPAWDGTMTDLSVYKPRPEELMYRKKIHQSKHLPSVKYENEIKKNGKNEISLNLGKLNNRQLAIMKEILYDEDQLKTVLEYSDRMMNKVADLCGDHPKRYQAFPSVTAAPNADTGVISKVYLPKEVPEFHSHLDTLSSSLMDLSALNDDCHTQGIESASASSRSLPSVAYTSHSDMEQFRKLLETEEKNLLETQYSMTNQLPSQSAKILNQNPQDVAGVFTPDQKSRASNTAVNDTTKVNKVRRVLPEDTSQEDPSSDTQFRLNGGITHSDSGFTLKDLKKVLEEMQREMVIYEENTGKVPAEKQQKETFSGYTMSLCQTVIKLCRYLRETDEKLQEQRKMCEELILESSELKLLIDALTLNLIETQDKYNSLYVDMKEHQKNTTQEIASLKKRVNLQTSHGMGDTDLPQQLQQQQSSLLHQQFPSSQIPSDTHQQDLCQINQLPLQNPHQLPTQVHAQLHTQIQRPQQQSSTQTQLQQLQSLMQQQLPHTACNFHSLLDDKRKPIFGSASEEVTVNGRLDSFTVYEKHQENMLSNFVTAFQLSPPVQRTRVVSSNSKDVTEFLSEADLSTSKSILYSDQRPILTQHPTLDSPTSDQRPVETQHPTSDTSTIPNKHTVETILPGQIPKVYPTQNNTAAVSLELPNLANVPVFQSVSPDIPKEDDCPSPEIESKSFLASQIEELNKQHEEAERLLQKFLQTGKEQEELLKVGGECEQQSQTEFQTAQGIDVFPILQSSNLISNVEHQQTLQQLRTNSASMFHGVSPAISPIFGEEDLD